MQTSQTDTQTETVSAFDALAALDALPGSTSSTLEAQPQIPGRFSPANVAPTHAPARELDEDQREALVLRALPELRRRPLRSVAASLGLAASTLRAWCLAYDGPAYEEALRAHIGEQLDACAGELEEAGRMAVLGASMTARGRKTVTSEGEKATSYTLTGPVMLAAARARSAVAMDRARFWQFVGERRLPRTFGPREDTPSKGTGRASFVFIVDGRKRDARVVGSSSTLPSRPSAGTEPDRDA